MSIDTDELLELLEKAQKERESIPKIPTKSKVHWTVRKFVKELGLISGPTKVPNYVLFYYYRIKWKGVHTPDKVNRIVFFRSIAKYFSGYRSNNVRQYLIDDSIFDMSRDGKLEAKQYDERERKQKKNFIQKRKDKKSKSKERPEHKG